MSSRFRNPSRLTWIFVAVAVAGLEGSAHAQLYGPDPYDPDGRPFKAYAYPGAGEVYGGMGGRPRPSGAYNGPNQFDRMDQDLGFPTTGLDARSGGRFGYTTGYDPSRYIPNEKADRKYFASREKQEQAMLKASLERDPKKRAQMMKEAEAEAKKNASDISLSVRRGDSAGRSNIPAPPARAARSRPAGSAASGGGSAIPAPPPLRSRAATTGSASPTAPPRNRAPADATDTKIPPPPPTSRLRDSGSTGLEPRPTDVLDRARNFDRSRETPGSNSPRRLPDKP
jgi:hypothetical protein